MKKAIIVMLFAVYLVAIVIVGTLGLNIDVGDGDTIFVKEVVCENTIEDGFVSKIEEKNGERYIGEIKRKFDKEDSNKNVVVLKCSVKPANASNKSLTYYCAESTKYTFVDNKDGTCKIVFNESAKVNIKVTPNDAKASESAVWITVHLTTNPMDIL